MTGAQPDHADGHGHTLGAGTGRRRLRVALAPLVAFMTGKVVAGIVCGSLALLVVRLRPVNV